MKHLFGLLLNTPFEGKMFTDDIFSLKIQKQHPAPSEKAIMPPEILIYWSRVGLKSMLI